MKLSDGGKQPPTGAVSSVMTAYGIVFSAINGAMKRSYTSNEAHILAGLSNVQENSQSEPSLVKP